MISIIVPVYNVEDFLRNCLDSIIAQSLSDWECLLIDDGSQDSSGSICDEYALIDSRFRVFHKQNGGVSSARNLGIDNADGEWITFIDSDDMIAPTYLEGLYAPIAKGEKLDLVHGGCTNWKEGKPAGINQVYEYYVGEAPEIVFRDLRGLTVSKLFRLENVRNWSDGLGLRFDEKMKIAEDMAFTLDYILSVRRFAFVSEVGYYYRIDNIHSATKQKKIPNYDQQLINFTHLKKSVFQYIQTYNLQPVQTEKRVELLSLSLFNLIESVYYIPKIDKKNRISLILDILSKNEGLLNQMSSRHKNYKYSRLLLKKRYLIFDILMIIKSYIKQMK